MNSFEYYKKLFDNRLLIITGAGRSGTSILGKLIGSHDLVYYLYEPYIFKRPDIQLDTLMEDYFIPLVQGRNINLNEQEESFIGHYEAIDAHKTRNMLLGRREDAVSYIELNRPLFVIKSPESLFRTSEYKFINNLKVLNIVRNGYCVIQSALKRGWFQDGYSPLEMCYSGSNIPLYIPLDWKDLWHSFSPVTRAAAVWCSLVDMAAIYSDRGLIYNICYEDLCEDPDMLLPGLQKWLGGIIKPSRITNYHIMSLSMRDKVEMGVQDIQSPIREKFITLMGRYNYGV